MNFEQMFCLLDLTVCAWGDAMGSASSDSDDGLEIRAYNVTPDSMV